MTWRASLTRGAIGLSDAASEWTCSATRNGSSALAASEGLYSSMMGEEEEEEEALRFRLRDVGVVDGEVGMLKKSCNTPRRKRLLMDLDPLIDRVLRRI